MPPSRSCTPLPTVPTPPPPPPLFALHNAPTPPQSRRKAALTPLHIAFTPLHAASHSPHAGARRCSLALPPLAPCSPDTKPPRRGNAALTPLYAALAPLHSALTPPSRRPHAAARRCSLGVGENTHELEKNAKMLEKINTIIYKHQHRMLWQC